MLLSCISSLRWPGFTACRVFLGMLVCNQHFAGLQLLPNPAPVHHLQCSLLGSVLIQGWWHGKINLHVRYPQPNLQPALLSVHTRWGARQRRPPPGAPFNAGAAHPKPVPKLPRSEKHHKLPPRLVTAIPIHRKAARRSSGAWCKWKLRTFHGRLESASLRNGLEKWQLESFSLKASTMRACSSFPPGCVFVRLCIKDKSAPESSPGPCAHTPIFERTP